MWQVKILLAIVAMVQFGKCHNKRASIFHMCDEDGNNKLTLNELKVCTGKESSQALDVTFNKANPTLIMQLLDSDSDGELSLAEYLSAVNNAKRSKSDMVDVIDKNGQRKEYSSDELFDRVLEGPEGLKQEGDKLLKEDEGTSSLEQIAKDNPGMSNIITMAQWSLAVLKANGVVGNSTVLRNLRTLPTDENGGVDNTILFSGVFEVLWVLLSV